MRLLLSTNKTGLDSFTKPLGYVFFTITFIVTRFLHIVRDSKGGPMHSDGNLNYTRLVC